MLENAQTTDSLPRDGGGRRAKEHPQQERYGDGTEWRYMQSVAWSRRRQHWREKNREEERVCPARGEGGRERKSWDRLRADRTVAADRARRRSWRSTSEAATSLSSCDVVIHTCALAFDHLSKPSARSPDRLLALRCFLPSHRWRQQTRWCQETPGL